VDVKSGVATLSGVIFDERERLAARVAAENVAGVKAVTDELTWVDPMSGMTMPPPSTAREL
jgi:osmotically-inducible protein OsmY